MGPQERLGLELRRHRGATERQEAERGGRREGLGGLITTRVRGVMERQGAPPFLIVEEEEEAAAAAAAEHPAEQAE